MAKMYKYNPEEWLVRMPGEVHAKDVLSLTREELQQALCYMLHLNDRLYDAHSVMADIFRLGSKMDPL